MLRPKKRRTGALECPTNLQSQTRKIPTRGRVPSITKRKHDPFDMRASYHTTDVPNSPRRESNTELVSRDTKPSGIARTRVRHGIAKTVDRYVGEDGKKYKTVTKKNSTTGEELSSRTRRTPFVRNPNNIIDQHVPAAITPAKNVIDSNSKRVTGGTAEIKKRKKKQ